MFVFIKMSGRCPLILDFRSLISSQATAYIVCTERMVVKCKRYGVDRFRMNFFLLNYCFFVTAGPSSNFARPERISQHQVAREFPGLSKKK